MTKSSKISLVTKKRLLFLVALLILSAGLLFALEKRGTIDLYSSKDVAKTDEAKTTSTVGTAQENFTSNSDRVAAPTPTDRGSGGIADTQGQDATSSDNSNWTVSDSGEITVYKPQKNT